jgi:hypothetical protein
MQPQLQRRAQLMPRGGPSFQPRTRVDVQLTPKNMLLRFLKDFATEQVAQSEPIV